MRSKLAKQGTAARIGALLFLTGALTTALGVVAPHSPQTDVPGFLADAAFQVGCAVILLVLPARRRRVPWIGGAVVVAGIAAVTAAVYFNGERAGGPPAFNEFFYVWPAFYSGYFFKARGMAASLALIAGAYAWIVAAIGATGQFAFTRWIVTVSVVTGVALAMHFLRRQIDRLVVQLRDTARTDSLTDLLNRRGFDERFQLELERARRTGDPLALLLGDLDRFKALNDQFGHPAGDAALVSVARTLADTCRSIDTVARVGGEEFALLLPATGGDGAFQAAERLRKRVARTGSGDGQPLTLSFGAVECLDHGGTPEGLLHSADAALYAAKAGGRNRTVIDAPGAVPSAPMP
jgi:diguanylate cyclase (GGDEF)-like protein